MYKLTLWKEVLTLDDALKQVQEAGLGSANVIRELGKALMIKKCLQEFNIDEPDDEARADILNRFKQGMKVSSDEAFTRWLEKNKVDETQLVDGLVKNQQVQRLVTTVVSDQMVREAFLKQKARTDQVVFSLIRVDSQEKAGELHGQITDGADFTELAKTESVGPEAEKGGTIGPRPLIGLNPELRQVLTQLKPGEVAEPFTLDEKQWFIVKLNQWLPTPFTQQVAQRIRQQLFEQWLDRQMKLAGFRLVNTSENTADTVN